MSSVLNLEEAPRADGGGELRRVITDTEGKQHIVDFWHDVCRFDSKKLEAVLQLAKVHGEYDLTGFIRTIEYQGFDRLFFIKTALAKMSVSVFCRFAILGAIRGSNFTRIVETCEDMPQDLITSFSGAGFVKRPKKKGDITILRCTASIPHWCTFYMMKAAVSKKIESSDCPAALQFPGAASLPMSKAVRMKHIAFCVAFSRMLPGGGFSITIYLTAMSNPIPIADIPAETLSLLEVNSQTESYMLTEDDVGIYTSQAVIKK
jgi:hypothetical protein